MNPGDTVTLYGEEVEIVAMAGDKAVIYVAGWNGTRTVEVDSLRRLKPCDSAATWDKSPWRPSVGTTK